MSRLFSLGKFVAVATVAVPPMAFALTTCQVGLNEAYVQMLQMPNQLLQLISNLL